LVNIIEVSRVCAGLRMLLFGMNFDGQVMDMKASARQGIPGNNHAPQRSFFVIGREYLNSIRSA
jgi:hypothetical protein